MERDRDWPEHATAGVDLRGIPTRACPACGCTQFKVLVELDEHGNISWYTLSGYCYGCESAVTLMEPIDGSGMVTV